jgi:hypothetical protein
MGRECEDLQLQLGVLLISTYEQGDLLSLGALILSSPPLAARVATGETSRAELEQLG